MPTPALLAAGLAILMLLAYVLRWAYRTWFLLVLASLSAAWGLQHLLATRAQLPSAPAYALAAAQRLQALPWPDTLAGQAQLLASFKGLRRADEVAALELVYRTAVLSGLVGEAPQVFTTVADALAWRRALGSSASTFGKAADPARRAQWDALRTLEDRALHTLLDVAWPAEWPGAPAVLPGSRDLGQGLWWAPKPGGAAEIVLQFPLRVTHRGEGRILDAQVALAAYAPVDEGNPSPPGHVGTPAPQARPLARERFACWVVLRDMASRESRLLTCELTAPHLQSPATQRLLAEVQALRAGRLAVWTALTVPLDYAPLHPPQAAPLNSDELARFATLEAADAQSARQALQWGQLLQGWLVVGGVALLGFAVPGARGRAVPLPAVLGQGAAVGVLAAVGSWFYMGQFGAMTGYAPLIVVALAGAAAVLFTGGVLLGNVVRSRSASTG